MPLQNVCRANYNQPLRVILGQVRPKPQADLTHFSIVSINSQKALRRKKRRYFRKCESQVVIEILNVN